MILPYSTKLNGKPTYFVEKIMQGLLDDKNLAHLMRDYQWPKNDHYRHIWSCRNDFYPKLHTIREDREDRWKVGNKIHMVINNRTKQQWQFAPVIPVVSIQKIRIEIVGPLWSKWPVVYIDDREQPLINLLAFVNNDGFESVSDFAEAFHNMHGNKFKGKIIHWTGLRY